MTLKAPFNKRITGQDELDRVQFDIEKAFNATTDAINEIAPSVEASDAHDFLLNFSSGAQTPTAATRTYIQGSRFALGSRKLAIGTSFHWCFNLTKTAAGVAASTFDIAVGTTGTVADAARVSFTKPAGTAAADEGWVDIFATVRGPLSTQGIMVGQFILAHNGNNVGHAVIPVVVVNTISAAFDVSPINLNVGVCITSGAADAITIQIVQAQMGV